MHLACFRHLPLRCVPYRVMGGCLFKLRRSIAVGPQIIQVGGQGLLRPGRKTGRIVIIWIVAAKVVGQLPPDNQLFEKCLRLLNRPVAPQNLQRCPLGRQLTEVQVRRQLGLQVQRRIIAVYAVVVQSVLQKSV